MKEYNDQELMYLIKENNESALNILYEKYKEVVSVWAKKYAGIGKKIGLEYNDIFQEGMVGLSEAINSYVENKDTRFSSFANMCINRQICSVLIRYGRKKHNALNEAYSLDVAIDDDSKPLLDKLFDDLSDPSIKLESEEERKCLYNTLYKELTETERQVFDLRVSGFEYKEICIILNKSYKSVDSALQRIKLKVKKVLRDID